MSLLKSKVLQTTKTLLELVWLWLINCKCKHALTPTFYFAQRCTCSPHLSGVAHFHVPSQVPCPQNAVDGRQRMANRSQHAD